MSRSLHVSKSEPKAHDMIYTTSLMCKVYLTATLLTYRPYSFDHPSSSYHRLLYLQSHTATTYPHAHARKEYWEKKDAAMCPLIGEKETQKSSNRKPLILSPSPF